MNFLLRYCETEHTTILKKRMHQFIIMTNRLPTMVDSTTSLLFNEFFVAILKDGAYNNSEKLY